ncbi:MAG: ACT domain-containing protein [Candidatus Altiarchaeales archaeon]|nr:ACT domain-containing protein [Candidatus Altiarchaeales archaeon]
MNMKSSRLVIENIIESDWRINQAYRLGLLNNRRLAQYIKPEVEAELGRKTSNAAVNQALYRLTREKPRIEENKDVLGESSLKLQDNISLYYLNEDFKQVFFESETGARNLSIQVKGMGLNTLILDRESRQKTRIPNQKVIKKLEDLSALILTSPKEIVEIPGVIAKLMTVLGANKINVVEVFSSYDTTVILVEQKQSMKALETIRKLIRNSNYSTGPQINP